MASSSSSTSPPSRQPYSGKWEHDVFLCFRGDVRDSFVNHLELAMTDKKINYFIDTKLQVTKDINELHRFLERTAISVVVFSEKFADSSWCLDEVHTVVQSMTQFGHRTLPVFFRVDWTTITADYHWYDDWKSSLCSCLFPPNPNTPYAKTIAGLSATKERKKEWMDSLKVVASMTGRTSESIPREGDLAREVVAQVLTTLASMSSGIELNNLVGMNSRFSKIEKLLAMEEEPDIVRIVGLWGIGGLGKSTLARTCYERLKRLRRNEMKFHFVDKINETCDKKSSIEELIPKIYSTLLSESNLTREDLNVDYRRERLSRTKIFLVLDDVQTITQLELLFLGTNGNLIKKMFYKGSRIIITTRNNRVLEYLNAETYHVEHLTNDEPLQLFKLHAFIHDDGSSSIPYHLLNLSHIVISYCEGNPLALKVLGGTLFRKDKTYWESFIRSWSEIHQPGIDDVLRRSYDELEDDNKSLFLDIACFFYGISKSLLIKYMETSYTGSYRRIEDLIGKSLLICTSDETQGEIVGVHSLLREMAWKIVNEEKRIEERSRLKDPYAVHNLLTSGEGRRATHGIHLDLSKSEDMHLKSNAFRGMESLKWLDFYSPKTIGYENKVQLSDGGELNYLPNELRGLNWDHFPFNSLPVGFSPRKLVYLAITHSPIHKCWELAQQPKLEYLVLLCLSNCENLTSVPNLSGCSNLEYLLLRQCKNLIELPSDIQFLDKLETLEATNCQSLKSIPPKLNSNFLKLLLLSNCPKLTFCPEVNNSAKLQALDLDGTPINNLPNSIYNVINGGHIKLYGPNITNFPKISKKLELLRLRQTAIREIKIDDSKFNRFHLIENALLTALPTNIWDMVSDELVVQDCPLIGSFPVISNPASHSLTTLRVKNCKRVTEFPSCICKLSCLEVVVFVGTGIRSEPTCIKELRRLPYLDLSYNASMESIPSTINELAKLTVSKQKLDVNVVMKVNSHGSSLPALVSTSNSKHNSQDLKQLHHNYPQLIGNSLVLAKLPHRHSSRLSKVSIHNSGSDQSVRMQVWAGKSRNRQQNFDEDNISRNRRLFFDEDSGDFLSQKTRGSQSRGRVHTRPTQRFLPYRKNKV